MIDFSTKIKIASTYKTTNPEDGYIETYYKDDLETRTLYILNHETNKIDIIDEDGNRKTV